MYAIDVGYGQLDVSLRNDPRVVNREKVNARYLQPENFDEPIEFVSIDVSFISLKLILPRWRSFCAASSWRSSSRSSKSASTTSARAGSCATTRSAQAAVDGVVAFAREIGFEVQGRDREPGQRRGGEHRVPHARVRT